MKLSTSGAEDPHSSQFLVSIFCLSGSFSLQHGAVSPLLLRNPRGEETTSRDANPKRRIAENLEVLRVQWCHHNFIPTPTKHTSQLTIFYLFSGFCQHNKPLKCLPFLLRCFFSLQFPTPTQKRKKNSTAVCTARHCFRRYATSPSIHRWWMFLAQTNVVQGRMKHFYIYCVYTMYVLLLLKCIYEL